MNNKQLIELKEATDFFIKDILMVKKGEKVLVYTEDAKQSKLINSITESIIEVGSEGKTEFLNPEKGFQSMAEELLAIIRQSKYNVICELSDHYFYQTIAWSEALKKGSRLYSVGGLDTDAFIRCIGKVNYEKLYQFGIELRRILMQSRNIQILSNEGTDIKIKMQNHTLSRLLSKFLRKQTSYIAFPSGFFKSGIRSTFMGGQVGFQGIFDTIEGRAIIDGYLWPPEEIGQISDPITLEIRKGMVVKINSHPYVSELMDNWFKETKKEVLHICIGFNPGATLSGKVMEAERVMGNVCLGFAKYPFHVDAIIKHPTVKFDGQTIIKDGSFLPERLALLNEKMQNFESSILP
jgi:leucyl aminopeptidase (aminopeptidase T)